MEALQASLIRQSMCSEGVNANTPIRKNYSSGYSSDSKLLSNIFMELYR